jgi:hypothetical protein
LGGNFKYLDWRGCRGEGEEEDVVLTEDVNVELDMDVEV